MSAPKSFCSITRPSRFIPHPQRLFSTCNTCRNLTRPESPRYIDIPQPLQQDLPARRPVKGFLPVPREIFAGKRGTEIQLDFSLRNATRAPLEDDAQEEPNNRREWQRKMSNLRRQNLLEGSLELRGRKAGFERQRAQRSARNTAAREKALHRAMREDERLTAQSNNFDVHRLMAGELEPDTTRRSHEQYQTRQNSKHEARMRDLHTLHTKARSFIVSKEQLDDVIESTFGTEEEPAIFKAEYSELNEAHSIWAFGKPVQLQDKADTLTKRSKSVARGGVTGTALNNLKAARISRIAEELTGGELGEDLLKRRPSR